MSQPFKSYIFIFAACFFASSCSRANPGLSGTEAFEQVVKIVDSRQSRIVEETNLCLVRQGYEGRERLPKQELAFSVSPGVLPAKAALSYTDGDISGIRKQPEDTPGTVSSGYLVALSGPLIIRGSSFPGGCRQWAERSVFDGDAQYRKAKGLLDRVNQGSKSFKARFAIDRLNLAWGDCLPSKVKDLLKSRRVSNPDGLLFSFGTDSFNLLRDARKSLAQTRRELSDQLLDQEETLAWSNKCAKSTKYYAKLSEVRDLSFRGMFQTQELEWLQDIDT